MNKHLIIGAALLPLAFITTSGMARMPGPPPDEQAAFLERFDTDGDGLVTRQEIEVARAAEFNAADSDADGTLSFSELEALEQQQQEERLNSEFALLDQDDSDGVSLTEFTEGHPQNDAVAATAVFGFADLDSGGSLSLAELDALKQGGPEPWRYANLDQDGDGNVSKDEFTSATPPHRSGGPGHR